MDYQQMIICHQHLKIANKKRNSDKRNDGGYHGPSVSWQGANAEVKTTSWPLTRDSVLTHELNVVHFIHPSSQHACSVY